MPDRKSIVETSKYYPDIDMLCVHFLNDRGDSYGSEADGHVEIFRDCKTDEITGFEVRCVSLDLEARQAQMQKMGLDFDIRKLCKGGEME